jgi:hypothetical protein
MQNEDYKQKCEYRIVDELEKELSRIREANEDLSGDKREDYLQNILSIDKTLEFKITLSWGGPADYFIISADPDNREIVDIRYQFQDWFDGAERTLTGENFSLVEDFFSFVLEYV